MNKRLSTLNKVLTKHQRNNSLLGQLSEPMILLQKSGWWLKGNHISRKSTPAWGQLPLKAIWPPLSLATVPACVTLGRWLVILLNFRNFLRFIHCAYFLNLDIFIYSLSLNEAPSRRKDFNSEEIAVSLIISLFFNEYLKLLWTWRYVGFISYF